MATIGNLLADVYGSYTTVKFTDVYGTEDEFLEDYGSNGIPTTISEASAKTLFYLLYARYGNSHIANSDENQFRYKLFSVIYQYGPTWEKRLEIQEKVRNLTDDELMTSYKNINNMSYNPSSEPTTASLEELPTINQQQTSTARRGKLGAYAQLWEILVSDVTESFLTKFRKLFLTVAEPQIPLWYETEVKE